MSDHYADRSADRQAKLAQQKSAVDEENQRKYNEQQEKHDQELNSKRAAAEQILKEEMEKLNLLRAGYAARLAETRAEMQNCINEKVKAHGLEGNEKVVQAKAELEAQHKKLESKEKLYKDQLAATANILEKSEKLRQEEHGKIKEEGLEKKKKLNEEFLQMNAKIHESKMMGQEQLRQLDEEANEKQLSRAEKEGDRAFGAALNTYELQNSMAIEDSFRTFDQKCQALIQKHSYFCIEFDSLEASLLQCHNRMMKNKEINDCDMNALFQALRRLRTDVTEFRAAGSTKEQEFTTLIRELTVLIEDLTTQFNAIQAKIDDHEPQTPETAKEANHETGILDGILEAKRLMKLISEKVQSFNVIPRDHLRETLAIQMSAAGTIRSAHHAIQYASEQHEIKAIGN